MQRESEEDRRTARHSAAVREAALQPLHLNSPLRAHATGMGQSHQKGPALSFLLARQPKGDKLLFKHR